MKKKINFKFQNKNYMNNWYGLKIIIKFFVLIFPFYNSLLANLLKNLLKEKSFVLRRIPIKNTLVRLIVNDNEVFLNNPNYDHIAKEIWWCNSKRFPSNDQKALEIFSSLSCQMDCLLDIGCNNGMFSILAAKANPEIKVYAFDILPVAIKLINENIVSNDVADKVFSQLMGISDHDGNLTMPEKNYSSSIPTSYSTNFNFKKGIKVKLITLDKLSELFNLRNMKNILIKIDVEGTEDNIFKSGMNFLSSKKPIILCEILSNSNTKLISKLLKDLSYNFYLIKDKGLEQRKELLPNKEFRDWIFINKEKDLKILGIIN